MDQLKQYWEVAKKYHFWILCGLVVLVPLIVSWVANNRLAKVYGDQMSTIKRVSGEAAALMNGGDHPNNEWVTHVNEETEKLRGEVKDAWEKLYKQQQAVLKWPSELGPDFIAAFSKPAANDDPRELEPLCERYQNNVKNELSHMADIVKAKWAPGETGGHAGPRGRAGGPRGEQAAAAADEQAYIVYWDPADEARLVDAYDWQDPPSPLDVRYAQEELWVLESICKAINRTNVGATGDFDAVIREIHGTLIGYDATNKNPLGEGEGRIDRPHKTPGMPGAAPVAPVPAGPAGAAYEPTRPMRHRTNEEGALGSSQHHRRGPPMAMGGAPMPGAPAGPADPDDWLKDGRFVDIKGKALRGAEWANSPTPEYNLMAFKLNIVADEQRWQKLLIELANSPLPLEVREVRINPSEHEGRAGRTGRNGGGQDQNGQDNTMHNVTLEIDGIAYLMNPPNLAKLGINPAAAAPPAAVPPAATPPAATTPTATPPTANPLPGTPTNPAAPATVPAVAAPATTPSPTTTPPTKPPGSAPPTGAPTPAGAPPTAAPATATPPSTTTPPVATPSATPAAK